MPTLAITLVILALAAYSVRRNIRRSWHVLRTGEEKPNWDALYQTWYGEQWEEFAERDKRRWWNGW